MSEMNSLHDEMSMGSIKSLVGSIDVCRLDDTLGRYYLLCFLRFFVAPSLLLVLYLFFFLPCEPDYQ